MACVSVNDNGSGMTPEVLRNIFEPFYTTKPKGQGTGLGLSTAYAMVRQHQGAIAVRSAPGEGTDFKLFFPTAANVPVTAAPPGTPAPRRLVILVEDEESVRKVTQEMLRHLGLDVLAFASAEDVLAAQATTAASVVVSDLLLPGMHGLDLIRKLRERQPALPAILITGCDEEQVRRAGAMPERTRVLHKPYRMAQFQEAMRDWTG
jgi:CheY-like chemotaxis protein